MVRAVVIWNKLTIANAAIECSTSETIAVFRHSSRRHSLVFWSYTKASTWEGSNSRSRRTCSFRQVHRRHIDNWILREVHKSIFNSDWMFVLVTDGVFQFSSNQKVMIIVCRSNKGGPSHIVNILGMNKMYGLFSGSCLAFLTWHRSTALVARYLVILPLRLIFNFFF